MSINLVKLFIYLFAAFFKYLCFLGLIFLYPKNISPDSPVLELVYTFYKTFSKSKTFVLYNVVFPLLVTVAGGIIIWLFTK